jgi:DNA mismatch endonuclease, patch repair protein
MVNGYTPREAAVTSKVMASIRRKDNKAEVSLRKVLYHRGFRYRLQVGGLPGRPDFAFIGEKVAVFVDGDFWHGRMIREKGAAMFLSRMKSERRDFWLAKLTRNIERDLRDTSSLTAAGWVVLRVWESEVQANVEDVANRIEGIIWSRRGKGSTAAGAAGTTSTYSATNNVEA